VNGNGKSGTLQNSTAHPPDKPTDGRGDKLVRVSTYALYSVELIDSDAANNMQIVVLLHVDTAQITVADVRGAQGVRTLTAF